MIRPEVSAMGLSPKRLSSFLSFVIKSQPRRVSALSHERGFCGNQLFLSDLFWSISLLTGCPLLLYFSQFDPAKVHRFPLTTVRHDAKNVLARFFDSDRPQQLLFKHFVTAS